MNKLTLRQQQVYDFVVRAITQDGFAPTLQEIAYHLGIKGNLGVIRHLSALEKKGYISRATGQSRGIVLNRRSVSQSLPLVGDVAAGPLTEALEEVDEHLDIDTSLIKGEGSFLLRVCGESMIDAHIVDGDLAVVRPQRTAENGDIVVAMVDGDATLKRFFQESGQIRLQPENSSMEPIILTPEDGEVVVIGKVTGLIRRMGLS